MSRRARNDAEAPGQDSFLDVVANLVGVLIILVMVVGTQARHAMVAAASAPAEAEQPALPDVGSAAKQVIDAENGIREMQALSKREDLEVAFRRRERDQLQLIVAAGEQELDAAKNKLSTEDRADFDINSRTSLVFKELADLDDALAGLSENEKPVEVVKHYPTPMAKTVFGKELHFRLQDGRLTYVPFEEFVARLKEDAPRQVARLKDQDSITEFVGPIQGFRMRYTLVRETVAVPVNGGVAKGERAALDQFILLPLADDLGEPVEHALAENSDFRTTVAQFNPRQYTVTLWVYPNSFQHFRPVRDALLKLGFITAGRPMPDGHPIGGSPDGSRSAAQ
jgi:hypothetical protein